MNSRSARSDEKCARIVHGNIQQKGHLGKRHEVALTAPKTGLHPKRIVLCMCDGTGKETCIMRLCSAISRMVTYNSGIPAIRLGQAQRSGKLTSRRRAIGRLDRTVCGPRAPSINHVSFFSPDSAGTSYSQIRSRRSGGPIKTVRIELENDSSPFTPSCSSYFFKQLHYIPAHLATQQTCHRLAELIT